MELISAAAIVFAINVLTSFLKKYVYPKFGRLGVQVVVFLLAIVGAWYMQYGASLEVYVAQAFVLFTAAVALYEVILKRVDFFRAK